MTIIHRRAILGSVAAIILVVAPAMAMFIDVQFIGGVDIAAFQTWSFGEGSPLPNQEVERAARATIEEQMTAKGYSKVEGKADCLITIHGQADEWFDGGLFKIEALDGKTGKAVWTSRGLSDASAYCSPIVVQPTTQAWAWRRVPAPIVTLPSTIA